MKLQKLIAFAFIGGSALVGVFIIGWQNFSAQVPSVQKPDTLAAVQPSAGITYPVNAVEPIPSTRANEISAVAVAPATQPESTNLTQQLGQRIAKSILDKNPSGPATVNNLQQLSALKPDAIVNQELADQLKNFDYGRFQPVVDIKKIKFAPADDLSANNHYLLALNTIFQEKIFNLPIDQANPSLADFSALKDAAAQALDQLYNLPVPKKLADYHVREIKIIGTFANAAAVIAQTNDDPLLALIAMESLSKNNQEFIAVNQGLQQYINTNQESPNY